jgi:cytidylate kinase
MKEQVREEPKIVAAAERQMHAWAMTAEQNDRETRLRHETDSVHPVLKFITISREAGAGGSEIGAALGRQLGWQVFDKNLLDQIAERSHLSRDMLDLVDETRSNWVFDVLGNWMDCKVVPHERYFALLCRAISMAARREHAVFVGRGAQFLLQRPHVFAVRVVASPEYRVRQIMDRLGMGLGDAKRLMTEIDTGRREFVERFYRRDITDPHHYDMVINVERSGREGAIQEILAAYEHQNSVALCHV